MHSLERSPFVLVSITFFAKHKRSLNPNDFILVHSEQPLKCFEHAEDIIFDELGVPHQEVLGVELLLYGAEKLLHLPVLVFYLLEDFAADFRAFSPSNKYKG